MPQKVPFAPVVLVGLMLACGGKSVDDGDESRAGRAGSAQGGTDSGGRAGGGSSSGGGSSGGGNANGGAAGKQQCHPADYEDALGGSVPVLVVNETSQPIYLGEEMIGCGPTQYFQVSNAAGQLLVSPGYCQATCYQLLTGNIPGCPAIACVTGSVTTLQPGEGVSSLWSAQYAESLTLPARCEAKAGVAECTRIANVEPGRYYFSAQAGSSIDCGVTGPDGAPACGPCTPTGSGGCVSYGAVIAPPLRHAKAEVQLDGSYGIGGPGGGGMVRSVEIVFKD